MEELDDRFDHDLTPILRLTDTLRYLHSMATVWQLNMYGAPTPLNPFAANYIVRRTVECTTGVESFFV